MDDEAQRKVSEGKYEEALTIYEDIIERTEKSGLSESLELQLGKAQVLILLSRYKESVDCFRKASSISNIDEAHISHLIDSLIKTLCRTIHAAKTAAAELTTQGKVLCLVCRGLPMEPTTPSCGHTICSNCISKLDNNACHICQDQNGISGVKVNVTMQEIIWKYFTNAYEACRKRLDGNALLKNGKRDQALNKYLQAFEFDPHDAPLSSNISHIMTQNGQFDKGLEYANKVCKLQPEWAKGFYRRGCALIGLQRIPEAAFSFLQCLSKHQTNAVVKKLVSEVMQDMFNRKDSTEVESADKLAMIIELMELFEKYEETKIEDVQEKHSEIQGPNEKNFDVEDFECTLCCRLLYKPVTTPCGHVFCKNCLNRSLDHRPDCPICRSSLSQVLASRNQNITEAIEKLMQTHLAEEYEERKNIHLAEMERHASVASNTEEDIPIFVCMLAVPTMLCPLHIFEPRYRLMVRQCMESGSKQFGMCAYDEETGFAEYGTMLVILDVQFLPDGRSLVNTIGGRRFKVLSRGSRDGYSIAKVEWITDENVSEEEEAELKTLTREVYNEASNWFNMLPLLLRRRIVNSVCELPSWQEDAHKLPHGPEWLWWLITVCPLDPKAQLAMLGLKSLKQRLLTMRRILAAIA